MAMLNHGSLTCSSSASHARPASLRASSASISAGERPADERAVDPGVERQLREPAQLGVGAEQQHVDAGDHLRDVLVGDVGQLALAEVRERRVGAVAEQQELEVVLPHQIAEPQHAAVGVSTS